MELLSKNNKYIKYPRTYHLPCSLGKTSDDKTLSNYSIFENQEVVATEKMDGENTTGYYNGYIHARSLDSKNHESRDWLKKYLYDVLRELPQGWRICGENLYAKHSIYYENLKSYFYLFSIWNEKNECLSWAETREWAEILNIQIVPVLFQGFFVKKTIEMLYQQNQKHEYEGFVLRNTCSFHYKAFDKNVGKFVREDHVKTDQHWMTSKLVKNRINF